MFDKPESGFDAFNPAWPAQLVVFLASEAAGDFNGQGFVVWGGEVMLVGGWHILNQISKPNAAFTAARPDRAQGRAVREAPRVPGYMWGAEATDYSDPITDGGAFRVTASRHRSFRDAHRSRRAAQTRSRSKPPSSATWV